MRWIGVAFAALLVGCASSGGGWVRADGAAFSEDQLSRDRLACFPSTPPGGPMSMGVEEAQDCMRSRGWVKAGSG